MESLSKEQGDSYQSFLVAVWRKQITPQHQTPGAFLLATTTSGL